ncbi:MAG: hypothetical protein ACYC6O_08405 [Thermoleophilia bacterium]
MNSPAVTAGGGGTVKKNFAWSAGAIRKVNAASITAKTPATFGLLSSRETSPKSGTNNPTVMKNPANTGVRSSFIRGSTPNGVNRKPRTKPNPKRIANIRFAFPKDIFLLDDEKILILLTRPMLIDFPSAVSAKRLRSAVSQGGLNNNSRMQLKGKR